MQNIEQTTFTILLDKLDEIRSFWNDEKISGCQQQELRVNKSTECFDI